MTEATEKEPTYKAFVPDVVHGIMYGIERVEDMGQEITDLWAEHWKETEVLYLSDGMAPDYENYVRYEKAGAFFTVTARRVSDLKMVGYIMFFLGPNMHIAGTMIAKEDAFFVLPEYRAHRSRVARKLLDYAQFALRRLGVEYMGMSDKSPLGGANLKKFLGRQGFQPIAVHYLKRL